MKSNDTNSEIVLNSSTLPVVADIPLPESETLLENLSSLRNNNLAQVESNISILIPKNVPNHGTFVTNNSQFDNDLTSRSESFIKSVLKSVTSTNVLPVQTAATNVIVNKPMTVINTTINKEQPLDVNISSKVLNKREETSKTKIKLPEPTAISVPTDPKEKLDLFKAIFLSSSEDESENEEPSKTTAKEEQKAEEMKKIILQDERVTPVVNKENNKGGKGIFADLDWSKVNKKTDTSLTNKYEEKSKEVREDKKVEEKKKNDEADMYGPKLPAQVNVAEWKPTFQKVNKKIDKHVNTSSDSADEWMEIDTKSKEKTKKSSKKHKKHKSQKRVDKSKHKKHKTKHKKKKDSDR